MGKRIVGWFVLIPLCAVIVVFALANRHPVAVNFNPLAPVGAQAAGAGVPLFLVVYAVLFVGVALGGAAVWLTQAGHRRRERQYRKQAEKLRAELNAIRRPSGQSDPALAAADDLA